jgi:uncharacterized CHY-type Zn-finger protein
MEYKCKVCVKEYSSYKSLWNHNKKFHKPPSLERHSIVIVGNSNVIENKTEMFDVLSCKFCKRKFKARQNRWSHEKICKIKNTAIIKQESKETKETNITNNINKGVINNNNNNTTNIIKFGSEDIINILTKKQIAKILNSRYQAIEESIRTVHFNKSLPEYQNIKIKNLRSNMALVHDGENFNAKNQYNTVYELIDNHAYVIMQLLEEAKISISEKTVEKLGELIAKLEDDYNKFIDESTNRKYKNYKDYKIDNVKTMIYNEGNKVKP